MMKCVLLLMLMQVAWIIEAAEVIPINKKLVKKKRGECVTFEGEHYYQTNGTFVWKKRETTTMVSGGRIRISGDRGNTVEIRQLEESDTAMYSAMIHTAGGLEITRHWLVVRGCDVNEKEIEFNGCEAACKAMCLEGWHHFDDKCYRYFSQPRTWLSAYYYCQGQFGAKLATIDSSEENDFQWRNDCEEQISSCLQWNSDCEKQISNYIQKSNDCEEQVKAFCAFKPP